MVKGKFSVNDGVHVYEGYHNPAVTWNGWKVPYLSLESTVEFLNYLSRSYGIHYEHMIDAYGCMVLYEGDVKVEVILPVQFSVGDDVLTLYPLEGYTWELL